MHLFTSVFTFYLLTTLFYTAISFEEDFYWKEYKGEIPSDAFPAGKDQNGNDTYIGQGYIHNYALAVGQIFPGEKEVAFPMYGVRKASRLIKILCTKQPNKLSWIPTTAKTFHVDTFGLHPVMGGADEHEPNKGEINIGRAMYRSILKVGAVASFNADDSALFFVHENAEIRASMYHTLIFNNSVVDTPDNAMQPCVDVKM